jgi:uncharacterized membrane protein YqjE
MNDSITLSQIDLMLVMIFAVACVGVLCLMALVALVIAQYRRQTAEIAELEGMMR